MLTRKQHELLVFIHDRLIQTGISPSFDEMRRGLRLRSKGNIHRLIRALEERGFLSRRRNRARALTVLRLPENVRAESRSTDGTRTVGIELSRNSSDMDPPKSGFSSYHAGDIRMVNLPPGSRIAASRAVEVPHLASGRRAVQASLVVKAYSDTTIGHFNNSARWFLNANLQAEPSCGSNAPLNNTRPIFVDWQSRRDKV